MGTYIKKIFWGDLSNIEEYEEYFSDMSREGIHLKKIGKFFLYFQEGIPQNLNYRIDLAKEDEKEIKVQIHEEKGWNFIQSKDLYLIFSSKADSNLKELYATPEKHKLSLIDAQKNNTIGNAIWSILGIIALLVIIYLEINLNDEIYLSLSRDYKIYGYILYLIPFMRKRREKRNLKRIEKKLATGKFLTHEGDYDFLNRKSIARKIFLGLGALFIIAIISYKAYFNDRINLIEIKDLERLPMITVEDIETMDYEHRKSRLAFKDDEIDYGNILYKDWSILIPKDYTLLETVTLHDKNRQNTKIEAKLIIDYYLGRFDFIARGLEKNILKMQNTRYRKGLEKIQVTDNFTCYGITKDDEINIFLRKNKDIIHLRYFGGTASMDEIIKKSLEKLDNRNRKGK